MNQGGLRLSVEMSGRIAVIVPTGAHSRGGEVGADGWQAAFVFHFTGLSTGRLVCPSSQHGCWLLHPGEQGQSHVFYGIALKITCHLSCHILLVTHVSPICGGNLHKDLTTERRGFLGAISEAGYHTSFQVSLQKHTPHALRFPCLPELFTLS